MLPSIPYLFTGISCFLSSGLGHLTVLDKVNSKEGAKNRG